jgi:hypothetical protein
MARSWIQQTLDALARERRGLPGAQMRPQPPGPVGRNRAANSAMLAGYAANPGSVPDPEGNLTGAAGNRARNSALLAGYAANPESVPEGPDVSMGPERATALMNAYQAYLKRSGRKQDPLLDRVRMSAGPHGRTQVDELRPAKVLMQDGEPFSVNTTNNERRGLTLQKFELPGGKVVHVYYGKNGERTVVRLPRKR